MTPRPVPAPARWGGGESSEETGKGQHPAPAGVCGGTHCRTTVSPKRTMARPRRRSPNLPPARRRGLLPALRSPAAPRPPLTSWPRPLPSRGGGGCAEAGRGGRASSPGQSPTQKGPVCSASPQPKQKQLPNLLPQGVAQKLGCVRCRALVMTSRRCSDAPLPARSPRG